VTLKFLIVCAGSVGDVYPLVAIGSALRKRGHEVAVVANPYYESLARENDLGFHAVGTLEQQQKMLGHPQAWHPRKGWKVWARYGARPPMREVFETVAREYVRGQTVVVTSWGGIGARVAQDKLGVPTAFVYMEPDKLRSVYDPPPFALPIVTWRWLPRWFIGAEFRLLDRTVIDRVLARRLNVYRAELSLPPVRDIARSWLHSPQRVIGLFPPWWGQPQADWPPQAVLTGFALWDRSEKVTLADDVERFFDAGAPPILFTPGAINMQAHRFFAAAIDCCQLLGRRGILLTKHAELLPRPLPPGVRHFDYLSFIAVLPRVAAVVHHAGIGTTAQCLAAGTPQLVMPTIALSSRHGCPPAKAGRRQRPEPVAFPRTCLGAGRPQAAGKRCGHPKLPAGGRAVRRRQAHRAGLRPGGGVGRNRCRRAGITGAKTRGRSPQEFIS
jgi:rhamnosyltransferase subunit B